MSEDLTTSTCILVMRCSTAKSNRGKTRETFLDLYILQITLSFHENVKALVEQVADSTELLELYSSN